MSAAALQAVRKFRVQEFKGLEKHILRFGPLPPPKSVNDPTLPRLPNPFVPRKNPKTGRWNDPKYSLRQQAELVKKAKAVGLLHLLPPGPKNPTLVPEAPSQSGSLASQSDELQELWAMRVEWEGSPEYKKVPGAELGARLYAGKKRMFKGHKWERVKAKRKAKRRVLLRDMDRRVSKYKSVRLTHAFCGSPADMKYSTTNEGDHIRSSLRAHWRRHPNCHFRVSTSSKYSNHRVVAASIFDLRACITSRLSVVNHQVLVILYPLPSTKWLHFAQIK
jgi:large subunit ribosomal protein L25